MSHHNGSSIICSHVLQTSSLKSATSLPLIWFSVIIVISCMNKLCFSSCVYILETSKLVLFCSGVCYNYLIIFIRYHLIVIYNGCYSYFVAWSVHMYFDTLCMYVCILYRCMYDCMYILSHKKHATLFFNYNYSVSWSIFILFVPMETGMNTVQSSYLIAWCCRECVTWLHVTKITWELFLKIKYVEFWR